MELTASSITPRSEAHAHPWLLRPSQAKRVLERSGRGSRIAQVQRMHWYTRASLVLTDAFAVLFTAAAALATARPLEVAFTPEALLKLSGVLAVSLALSGSYRRVAVHPAIEARRTALVLASVFGGGMAGLYALSGRRRCEWPPGAFWGRRPAPRAARAPSGTHPLGTLFLVGRACSSPFNRWRRRDDCRRAVPLARGGPPACGAP